MNFLAADEGKLGTKVFHSVNLAVLVSANRVCDDVVPLFFSGLEIDD